LEGKDASLLRKVVYELEVNKNHRPNARPTTRTIIIARRILLPKNLLGLVLISSGIVIQNTTVKNR